MVFQVFVNRVGDQSLDREVLLFPNRQYADEFYNRCITTPVQRSPILSFLCIVRLSPQFWYLDTDSRTLSSIVQSKPEMQDLLTTVMPTRIPGYDQNHFASGIGLINPEYPTSDVEYRDGQAYYIRTKSVPHQYWFLPDSSRLRLDETKKTKFMIIRYCSTPNLESDELRVLERKDLISILALGSRPQPERGIYVHQDYLIPASRTFLFNFGDFYDESFGVDWTLNSEAHSIVTYRVPRAGEEWELVH
ncbi:hypothetical protein N7490_012041 [Penicillium lividum]|nr:hypothetical protein N7490_012041 [Penicillium lividum]